MTDLSPLEVLRQVETGRRLPLPSELQRLYGQMRMPAAQERPHVYGNFVTTLDGVVSLTEQNMTGGGEISGYNKHDQMVMGILRASADAVVVGAGTLRAVPHHIWTADFVFPELSDDYQTFRHSLGKDEPPLNVIVTGRGEVDLRLPVFSSGRVPALIVTTEEGAAKVDRHHLPPQVKMVAVARPGDLLAAEVLDAIKDEIPATSVLVEGGPHLIGTFLEERSLNELFLTLAPQVAGRLPESDRPGLVEGVLFAPHRPLWATLTDVRLGGSHLFLRYLFGKD